MSAHIGSATSVDPHIPSLEILKYPRTPHLEGSRLQPGDEGHEHVRIASLAGRHAVIEEKLDGANAGISFTSGGELLLQSRGHYLVGGGRERQFGPFKQWATAHEACLLERLEDRYVMYGEWLYAKHSVSYDQLPHWFCEFDIYDRVERNAARDTTLRQKDLERMLHRWEVPLPWEAHEVLYEVGTKG
ncbi:RNA ligase family protein [Piscinibacter gummiphilus]|uniref:RNA ligase family protein n=1 Tax=Piscinibacter gummiphilus TaxID=946333 RepID=UPI000A270160|nr:RNA ligase family protein [Piscinibacter gummiphilus]ATU67114.1 hypothetical protein CPZ87_22445 [Piscinibacter gummiphilus]GLS97996.1 hypothetical protein GCM10007918_52880 [Piscinibacter gummiphilus]